MPRTRKMKHKASPRPQRRPPPSPSSQPSKPPLPSFVPSQSTGTRTPGSSPVEQLPDKVLGRIFDEFDSDRNSATLRLSRRLLPFAVQAFYRTLDTMYPENIVNLYAVLRHRPALRDFPRMFMMSAKAENGGHGAPCPDDIGMEVWPSKSAKKKARRNGVVGNPLDKILSSCQDPFDPARYVYCGELLRHLFELLPNLRDLLICNKILLHRIFKLDFVARGHFKALKFVNVTVAIHHAAWEDYDTPEDRDICALLARLPALESLEFSGNDEGMPCPSSIEPSTVELVPRSWSLETFRFARMDTLGEFGSVCRAFNHALTTLRISTLEFFPTLRDDLLLLPDSLTTRDIVYGSEDCGGHFFIPPPLLPTIDNALLRLTNLEYLKLNGPLVSRSFWSSVRKLRKLKHLIVGYHLHLVGKDLLALVSGPERLDRLHCLHLNLCHCPIDPEEDLTRRPRWEEEFKLVDANKILRALERAGIKTGGNLQCAARFCDRNDGHECSRKYAPI